MEKKKKVYATEEILEIFEEFNESGVYTIPECGCVIEMDGVCEHGNKSPLLEMDLI